MKKVYLNPEIVTYQIQTQSMLATSQTVTNTEFNSEKGSVFGREDDFDDEE